MIITEKIMRAACKSIGTKQCAAMCLSYSCLEEVCPALHAVWTEEAVLREMKRRPTGPLAPFIPPTDEELRHIAIDKNDITSRLMWIFRTECARLEQANGQRKPPSPAQIRRMEYEAVKKIAELLGVEIR